MKLVLFSLAGEEVYAASLQAGVGANSLTWNLGNHSGSQVASGLYIYVLSVETASGRQARTGKAGVLR